jgi:hypothetical protein
VHRIGYAFCAQATEPPGEGDTGSRASRPWLQWDARVLALRDGENLIGRDPASHVWLDESGVSRRHARLMLDGDRASIEDLGSKNGTWVSGEVLHGSRVLSGGERVQIGPLRLEFRTPSSGADTETVRLDRGRRKSPRRA